MGACEDQEATDRAAEHLLHENNLSACDGDFECRRE